MKEINLAPYPIGPEGPAVNEDQELIERSTMEPRKFLGEALLSPILKLGGLELLAAFKFADKIQTHEGDTLLVDDDEYKRLKQVTEIPKMAGAAMGFSVNEVEIVRRILEAPDVEVEKKDA